MIIYIAGPITGRLDYKARFEAVESKLRNMGHIVINPSLLPDGLKQHQDYMHICKAMIDTADGVYMLEGWEDSKGAKIEKDYAQSLKKSIFYE